MDIITCAYETATRMELLAPNQPWLVKPYTRLSSGLIYINILW